MPIKLNSINIKQNKDSKYNDKNKRIIQALLGIVGACSLCFIGLSLKVFIENKKLFNTLHADHSAKYNPSPKLLTQVNKEAKYIFDQCKINISDIEINGLSEDKTTINVSQSFNDYIKQMIDHHMALSQLFKDFDIDNFTYLIEGYLISDIDIRYMNIPLEKINIYMTYSVDSKNISIQDLRDKYKFIKEPSTSCVSLPGEYYRIENSINTCTLNVTCQYLLQYFPDFADKYKFRKVDRFENKIGPKDILFENKHRLKKYQEDIRYNAMQALKFAEDINATHSPYELNYLIKYLETQTQMTEEEKKKELARFVSHCISVQANKEEKGHLIYRINKNTVISDDGVMLMPLRAPIYTLQNITGIIIQILLSSKKNSKDIYVLSQNLLNDPNSQELTKCIANNIIKIAHE